jgi:DNA replication protein DnaC
MTPIERLQTALNGLGLKAVEARLESLLEQASKKEPSYADFLDELLSCEVDARRSRYLRARLQLAHLPFLKNFDQFDFGFQPSIDERQIQELRSLRFDYNLGMRRTHISGREINDLAIGYDLRLSECPSVQRHLRSLMQEVCAAVA